MSNILSKMSRSELIFSEIIYENIFSQLSAKNTLKYQISKSRYRHLKDTVNNNFYDHLHRPLGEFLFELKIDNNLFYRSFLNKYGDLHYTKFKIKDPNHLFRKGIYAYVIEEEIYYIGRCLSSFNQRINSGYGNISPKNCYLDGQETNCHINNLILQNKKNIELCIEFISDNRIIIEKEKEYIYKYNPRWNIQLTTAST